MVDALRRAAHKIFAPTHSSRLDRADTPLKQNRDVTGASLVFKYLVPLCVCALWLSLRFFAMLAFFGVYFCQSSPDTRLVLISIHNMWRQIKLREKLRFIGSLNDFFYGESAESD